ncbi:MAG: hypothetical protein QOH90_1604 [Actinomycetota bacterium]|nr:hypothetical protein [Actinomycetota bacterium]
MLGFGRAALGTLSFLAPKRTARFWTGESPEMAVSHMAVRGMGARDVALGLGMLIALENDGPVRGWLEASALADAGDAASTILSWKRFGSVRKVGWLAIELAAAYYAMQLADSID